VKKIVVLGSLNIDMVMTAQRLPVIGETVHGDHIQYMMGGKGLNQAVAASRMDISTSIIGCVGDDSFGEQIKTGLAKEKLDTSSIIRKEGNFTGTATVFITNNDNAIMVIAGANDICDISVVDEHIDLIKEADVLLTQLEIPMETVEYALQKAKKFGVKTILNPAPYKELAPRLFDYIDYLTPNETEFEGLIGKKFHSSEELEQKMFEWSNKHNVHLIVTRGSTGSSYIEDGKVFTVPSIQVNVVDTTGAGDTFNGILAYGIAEGKNLRDAVRMAGIGVSLSVTALGAQSGMPSIDELEAYMKRRVSYVKDDFKFRYRYR